MSPIATLTWVVFAARLKNKGDSLTDSGFAHLELFTQEKLAYNARRSGC
jgi:hypothetical protein